MKQCITKEIRKQIKEVFSKYQLYRLIVPYEWMPKITVNYSIVPPARTNDFKSSAEAAALHNAEEHEKMEVRKQFITSITQDVNRLNDKEREIIVRRYMQNDNVTDIAVCTEMFLSNSTYRRTKRSAFLKLAISWGFIKDN